MGDVFQNLSAVHTKGIQHTVYHLFGLRGKRQSALLQRHKAVIVNGVVLKIPEQIIDIAIHRAMHPRFTGGIKQRFVVNRCIVALNIIQQLLQGQWCHLMQRREDIGDHRQQFHRDSHIEVFQLRCSRIGLFVGGLSDLFTVLVQQFLHIGSRCQCVQHDIRVLFGRHLSGKVAGDGHFPKAQCQRQRCFADIVELHQAFDVLHRDDFLRFAVLLIHFLYVVVH